MPLYEYQCDACGKRFEIIQKFSDAPPEVCRVCGGAPVQRLFSSPAIQFKGTGWYITDYAQKGKPAKESSGESSKDGGGAGQEKDAKPASSAETSSTSSERTSQSSSAPAAPTPKAS